MKAKTQVCVTHICENLRIRTRTTNLDDVK